MADALQSAHAELRHCGLLMQAASGAKSLQSAHAELRRCGLLMQNHAASYPGERTIHRSA